MGLVNKIKKKQGIAPIKGPKKGITLVTPTITDTRRVYGIFIMLKTKKVRMPIMILSIIFPRINPPKT